MITILWISGCINALNWIDGLDGLAGGYGFITSLGLIFFGIIYGNYDLSLLAALISGGCLGFYHTIFIKILKKKIIMGDGGSYLIGCALALLTIQVPFNQKYIFKYCLSINFLGSSID